VLVLVFDFDGVILETEGAELRTWQEIWADHGQSLPVDRYLETVGSSSHRFDPHAELEARLGRALDRSLLRARRAARSAELLAGIGPLPGVERCLDEADALGLGLAIASSSDRAWVEGHLARLRLRERFHRILCRGDVARVKPAPDLYAAAVAALGARPADAIALEDSANGIAAAKAAGLVCVAIPTEVTQGMPLEQADLRLRSLEEGLPLEDLLARARAAAR
jgi:HAD superfamily hydrolase (TIGR01509 family)